MSCRIKRTRFQSFVDDAEPEKAKERLDALRAWMRAEKVDAFVLPRSDAWQNEYLRACDERLKWLTGFTGSAGLLVVLAKEAALFVDGRYTIQARQQVRDDLFEILQVPHVKPQDWLAERLEASARVVFDPWLMTKGQAGRWCKALKKRGAAFEPVWTNPVDALWADRPPEPDTLIFLQPETLAGRSVSEKLKDVKSALAERQATHALITLTDSISWLFNIRGRDIPHTPVVLAFALVPLQGPARLFIAPQKVPDDVRKALAGHVEILAPDRLKTAIASLPGEARVLIDPAHAAEALYLWLEEAGVSVVEGEDPCLMPKACKTEAEQEGMRAAHVRDGVALCRFLAWLEEAAAHGEVDEIDAVAKLEAFRIETAEALGSALFDISFDTISGAGPNGAIVHYRVTCDTVRPLKPGSLYLVDSGGQYLDGTTDVTRTVFIGPPDLMPRPEQKFHFTLVLKGMIALSRIRFPEGTTGAQLDGLARQPLWQHGLDYDHGTGHGVGAFLSVHEGPQRISRGGDVALRPGMITSNEPGYNREGHYGIRIENLILCKKAERREGEERAMLSFETLTMAPIDRRLIEPSLLSAEERAWLDAYHAHVARVILPLLEELGDTSAQEWLKKACAPL